jgi:hypothetical protein
MAMSQAESKPLVGIKIIFGVAIINLAFLGFELIMNEVRTAIG